MLGWLKHIDGLGMLSLAYESRMARPEYRFLPMPLHTMSLLTR